MPRSALILANGEPPPAELLRACAAGCEWLVCTDGAAAFALACGVAPQTVLGDLDSLDEATRAALGTAELLHIAEQECNDLEKACYTALARGVTRVHVLGAGGLRWDQFHANLSVFARYAARLTISAEDACGRLRLLPVGASTVEEPVGSTISLLALPRATGVTLTGFRYPLDEALLELGLRDGVSNEVASSPATVRYTTGCLALYVVSA